MNLRPKTDLKMAVLAPAPLQGEKAIALGASSIMTEEAEIVVAGGQESTQ